MPRPSVRVALGTIVVGAVAFVVVAVWRVPWHPVPGGPVHPVSASTVFSQAQIHRAETYTSWIRVWSWSSLAVSLVLAGLLGFTRWGARLVARLRGPWWGQVVVAVTGLELVAQLLALPFGVLIHHRVVAYGLSHEGWGAWTVDLLTALAVSVVTVALGLVLVVGCARRLPRAWPAVAGGLLAAFVMVGSFVYPLLIEPLSNNFTPLPNGELRSRILALAKVEHVHVDDVLVADASRRTTTLNAYVSGYGSSRRVVVYDNLLTGSSALGQREVLSVVGHELAHAHHDDVLTGSLLGAAAAPIGIGLLALVVGGRRREDGADGVDGDVLTVADPRAVPRVLALVLVAMLLVSPVENTISRRIETRADVDSLRYYGDPQAFIALQKALAVTSLSDPNPPALSQFWFGTHPTGLTRIAIAERFESR